MIAATGLDPLIRCSVITTDPGLISAFVERWHRETSSFHLPVGEVTITLDDVSSLLHIPITGALHSFESLVTSDAVALLMRIQLRHVRQVGLMFGYPGFGTCTRVGVGPGSGLLQLGRASFIWLVALFSLTRVQPMSMLCTCRHSGTWAWQRHSLGERPPWSTCMISLTRRRRPLHNIWPITFHYFR